MYKLFRDGLFSFLFFLFVFNFLVSITTGSIQLLKTYTLVNNIEYMGIMANNTMAVYHTNGILRLYDASMTQIQQIMFTDLLNALLVIANPIKLYSISPDLNTLAINIGYTFCSYNLLTDLFTCYNQSILNSRQILAMCFMENRTMVIIFGTMQYQYINLDVNGNNQFFNSSSTQRITAVSLDSSRKMLLATGLKKWKYNLSNNSYGPFSNYTTSNEQYQYYIIQSLGPYYVAMAGSNISNTNSNIINFYNFTIFPPSTVFTIQSDTKVTSIRYYDSTVLITYKNGTIQQYQLINFRTIKQILVQNTSVSAINQVYLNVSDRQSYIYIYNTMKNIYVYRIRGMTYCLSINSNCIQCNLTTNLCLNCSTGYNLNIYTNKCQIITQNSTLNNTQNNTQNTTQNSTQNSTQNTTQNSTQNSTQNTTQNSTQNTTNNKKQQLRCKVGYQIDNKTGQCSLIVCQDINCSLCRSMNYCIKCKRQNMFEKDGICITIDNLPMIKENAHKIATVLSVPSIKMIMKPISPFFIFLDDYWYYIYHNRSYQLSIQLLFNTIIEINNQKIVPQFVNFSQIDRMKDVSHLFTSDYSLYTPNTVYNTDQTDIQFLKNTQDLYTWGYFSSVLILFIFKAIYAIFYKYKNSKQHTVFKFIANIAFENSLYKTLLASFFESNIIYISFYASLQLTQPSAFTTADKANNIITYLFLFTTVLFSFTFYILIYTFCNEEEAQIFLPYNKNNIDGFICQTFLSTIRNFFNGFIHAFLIYHYPLQIISLVIVKIFMIATLYCLSFSFQKKPYFIFFEGYFGFGIILDLVLFLENENRLLIFQSYANEIQLYTLCLIGICSIILVMLGFYYSIKQLTSSTCNNQIIDINQQQKNIHQQQALKNTNKQQHNIQKINKNSITSSFILKRKLQKIKTEKNKLLLGLNINKQKKQNIQQEETKKVIKKIFRNEKNIIKKTKDSQWKKNLFVIQFDKQDQF